MLKMYTGRLFQKYKEEFKQYENLLTKLEEAKNSANATESQIEFLKFQINEIEEANIQSETEDEELSNELEVLANAEKLKRAHR